MKLKLYISFVVALLTIGAEAREPIQGFMENKGQVTNQYLHSRSDIDFALHSSGLSLFIGNGELHYQFAKPIRQNEAQAGQLPQSSAARIEMYRVDVELIGADRNVKGIAEEIRPDRERYYTETSGIEGWIARSCNRIVYQNIYPGIDWVIYTKEGTVKYDFVVKEGADPSVIKFRYKGASSLEIDSKGGFTATSSMGSITEAKPYCYTANGNAVASSFILNGDELSYHVADYKGTLTIDPAIAWGTYYGSSGTDEVRGVTHDALGYSYIAGSTNSVNNIATVGSHQQTFTAGFTDAFMAKIDPLGNRVWATYYGGTSDESFYAITIDNNNKLYVGGSTASTTGMATPGTHQPAIAGASDALLVKFDTTGVRLWATYYGGNSGESIRQVACDNSGNVFVGGNTQSTSGIASTGAHQQVLGQGFDAFVAKFSTAGARLWGTYYGGLSTETGSGLCVDNSGSVYLSGVTNSDDGISTPGSHQPLRSTADDLYLVKFNASGIRQWGTYYGGDHVVGEAGGYVAYDGIGGVFLAGTTRSETGIATPGTFQPLISYVTYPDGFIVKINEAGVRQWGSYYGGLGTEVISGVTCDNTGNVFLCGNGSSVFFSTACSPQPQNAGFNDCFVGKAQGNGLVLLWSTYLGGNDFETAQAMAYDGQGNLFVAGSTGSVNNIGTANVHQPLLSNGLDGFLVKYIDCAIPGVAYGVVGNTPVCEGDTVLYTVGEICGAVSYIWDVPNDWYGYSTADTFLAVIGSSGTINVYATSGCGASSPQSLTVTAWAAPEPVVTQGVNIVYTTTNYLTYQWSHNGILIPGATFPFYDYTQMPPGGYFTVTVTDSNGCKGTSPWFMLGVDEVSLKGLNVYPNPAHDEVFVTGLKEDMLYEIRNLVGSKLKQGTLKATDGKILLGDIPKGVYTLKIAGQSLKLVKD